MKLSYYGYSVERHSDQEKYLFDMRGFVDAFSRFQNFDFKNRFFHAGENVNLLRVKESFYLYLITRSQEVIKKIKSSDHTVSEINKMLSRDERLGFASYVYFGESYIGFASTIMAPKTKSFAFFVNDVFDAVGLSDYRFVLHPFFQEATYSDAMSMPFLGRSSIQVNKDNKFYEDIRNFFNGTAEEFKDVDSFEVVVKPKKRQNIDAAVKKVISSVGSQGIEKFVCRAKHELSDHLMDMYLVGNGMISDMIPKGSDSEIYDSIIEKVTVNDGLVIKREEHQSHESFKKERPKAFSGFFDVASWSDMFPDL
jgi:hypothetical protein